LSGIATAGAAEAVKAGDVVESGERVEPKIGNCMPLSKIPLGLTIHNIELTPGKGGQTEAGVPVFDTVAQAVAATGADASIIYVPARFSADAILEAVDAGIRLVVTITEGVPVHDMLRVTDYLLLKGVRMIGPNCPGLITPGQAKVGIIPGSICLPGRVGVVSRSGTLTYEVLHALTERGIGQSTAVGMGGDPVHGVGFIEAGEVEIVRGLHGAQTRLAVLGPGAMIGEGALLDDSAHSTSAFTRHGATVLAVPRAAWDSLRGSHPDIYYRIVAHVAQRLSERLRYASEQLASDEL